MKLPVLARCDVDDSDLIEVLGGSDDGTVAVHVSIRNEASSTLYITARDARRIRKALKLAIAEEEAGESR